MAQEAYDELLRRLTALRTTTDFCWEIEDKDSELNPAAAELVRA